MKSSNGLVSFLAKFSLVILSFLLIYYFFAGVGSTPWEADSVAYHIPISNLILSGRIFNPGAYSYTPPVDFYRLFQPGASEIILSIFSFLKIPLNLFNVAGVIFLFFVMRALAKSYEISDNLALVFASSVATLHLTMRWVLTQTIDIWLAVFFGLSIVLLRNPKKSYKYFLFLGFALGMLFGSKYTGPAYAFFLAILFGKEVLKFLNIRRFLAFLAPFSVLGLSWYIRNLILTGDPYYPQSIPFFRGIEYHVLDQPVWKMFLYLKNGLLIWINSFISEYTIWCLALLAVPMLLIWLFRKLNKGLRNTITRLVLLSLLSFIIYLFLPSGPTPSLVTSVFRYTYPVMIPLILSLFILAKKYTLQEILAVIAVTSMLIMPELSYHPKILILLIPVALLVYKEDLLPQK